MYFSNLNHDRCKFQVRFTLEYSGKLTINSFSIQKYTKSADNQSTTSENRNKTLDPQKKSEKG